VRLLPFLELIELDSFLVNLIGEQHYLPLTMLNVAKRLLMQRMQQPNGQGP